MRWENAPVIIILKPDVHASGREYQRLLAHLAGLPNVEHRVHEISGTQQTLTEIYLIGNTSQIDQKEIEGFEIVDRVVRVSREYRILGRHKGDTRAVGFEYNGVRFDQDSLHVFAGLCAVSTRDHVEQMLKALHERGQVCTRMGAYKPRTSPYSFQGHGRECLPYVLELAGKYGIRVIAMEVTHEDHVDEISAALDVAGRPTGVMLQIGTRNIQNFELLKSVGRQRRFPVLIKRGFGITLDESLNAAEYLASEGNHRVVFCLRGMKTNFSDPHRNMVDFAHVPVIQRLTRMPVCIDPSHSVGSRAAGADGILDVMHVTAQGVVAGANMVLVDFHPEPAKALVDGPQALTLDELGWFLDDVSIARRAYLDRRELMRRQRP
jgi:3-deoxy-7-phosphoheptulonate synthase